MADPASASSAARPVNRTTSFRHARPCADGIHVFAQGIEVARVTETWMAGRRSPATQVDRRAGLGDHHGFRTFRRPDRRRRLVRHRRGLSPAAEVPGQEFRHSGGPGLYRRHLGSVPLSRHPLRLGHVHAGLFLQAVGRGQGDRRRAADLELCPRDRGRERHRQEYPLPSPGQARVMVDAGGALDRGGRTHLGRGRHRDSALHLQFPVHVLGLLQIRGRLHAGICRPRQFCRPHRASAEMA